MGISFFYFFYFFIIVLPKEHFKKKKNICTILIPYLEHVMLAVDMLLTGAKHVDPLGIGNLLLRKGLADIT